MAVSSPATIAVLMRTNRLLYDSSLGPRLLLGDGVCLSTSEQLISFSRFMNASRMSRYCYLQALTISRGGFSPEALSALTQVLVHPSLKIASLILRDAERILSSGSRGEWDKSDAGVLFFNALQNIRTLKHLVIDDLDERASTLLRGQSSALVSASLTLNSSLSQWHRAGQYDPDSYNPIVLLANSADTLEMLDGRGFDVNPDNVMYDVVYPRVWRVCASYWSDSMPATAPYVHSYPNLEHLALTRSPARSLRSGTHAGNSDASIATQVFQRRHTNKQDQMDYGSWQRLRVVEGTVQDVFILGLVCHVPHVRLCGEFAAANLADVLADVKPETLSLTVTGGHWFEQDGAASVALAWPEAQCLHSLELEICFAPEERDKDLQHFLTHLTRILAHMPALRSFSLTLNLGLIIHPQRGQRDSPGPSEEYHCPMVSCLRAFDAETHATLLKADVPSLEDATIKVCAERTWNEYMMPSQSRRSMMPSEWGSLLEEADADGDGSASEEEEIVPELAELGFGTIDDDEDGW
ncbi:hypothetical protein FKP32DRAFT_1570916 [Trametes sanguinea]|nr:hypothetical protein FKP32DRAFT_1570916 [Trametes sanguinea]